MADEAAPAAEAEAARVGEAAAQASAASGAPPAEARADAREAVADTPAGAKLTDQEKDEVADRVIDRLEARGAFEDRHPEPATPAGEPATPAAEPTPAEQHLAEHEGEGPRPRRKFAERFAGRQ